MINFLKSKSKYYTFQNFIVLLFSLGIFIGPLVKNNTKGWELPKVYFWQEFALALIFIILLHKLYKLLTYKKLHIGLSTFTYLFLTSFLLLQSLFNNYGREVNTLNEESIIYRFIYQIIPHSDDLMNVQVGVFGNTFRYFGIITLLILITLFFLLRSYFTKKNINLFFLAFIASALTQSILSFQEVLDIVKYTPQDLFKGIWVFGSFGQANFYAGHLILGFFFCLYYVLKKHYGFIPILSVIILGLMFSASLGGMLSILLGITSLIILNLKKRKYKVILSGLTLTSIIIFYLSIPSQYSFRITLWKSILNVIFTKEKLVNVLFGGGLDTLGDVLSKYGFLPGLYADRAHNLYLDVLFSLGVIGLLILIYFVAKALKEVLKKRETALAKIILSLGVALFIRNFIHTSSIVNIIDLFTILTIGLTFQKVITDTD